MLCKLGFSLSIATPASQGFRLKIYENFRRRFKPNDNQEKHSAFEASVGEAEKPAFRRGCKGPERLFTFTSA
jgi:hypothetical protein